MKTPASKQPRKFMLPKRKPTTKNSLIQNSKINQLRFELPRLFIQKELDDRGVERQTDIWIYEKYPIGYTAVVGAHDKFVYVFEVEYGKIVSTKQKLCLGVRPNGSLIY